MGKVGVWREKKEEEKRDLIIGLHSSEWGTSMPGILPGLK